MKHSTLHNVISFVLIDEGGIEDVGDGKGITSFGQTPTWLKQWNLTAPAKASEARNNYVRYFEALRATEIVDASLGLGYAFASFAIHAGETRAIAALQRALDVPADGVIGPMTLGAFRESNHRQLAYDLAAAYLEHLGPLLASTRKDRRKWANGWLRRAARIVRTLGE